MVATETFHDVIFFYDVFWKSLRKDMLVHRGRAQEYSTGEGIENSFILIQAT